MTLMLRCFVLFALSAFRLECAPPVERVWRSSGVDDGSVHTVGNGRLIAYEQGPDVIQLFGPPYSAPSVARLAVDTNTRLQVRSRRDPGAAVWVHAFYEGGTQIAEATDFVDSRLPCFVRRLRCSRPLRFRLVPERGVEVIENRGLLMETPAGASIYMNYPVRMPLYHQLVWTGAIEAKREAGEGGYTISCAGDAVLFWAGGPDYPDAIRNAEEAKRAGPDSLLGRTREMWTKFAHGRKDFAKALPRDLPQRERLLQVIDDVAVLIRVQQAAEGSVLAGYPYHLGYVRDQYGVSRALLALGHAEEAKQILRFYQDVWRRHGKLHNAQGIGVDGLFHHHENDEVESTGYLIVQAFDFLERTGDARFLAEISPMLEWAWEAQKRHLAGGMLPFNGDETYVAGGVMPRTALNDGSAEATLLFVEGGRKWLAWIEKREAWPQKRIAENRRLLESVARSYRRNFFRNGRLITNNPERTRIADLPRFRHGVCERCMAEGRFRHLDWTERNESGRYLCPACLRRGSYPAAAGKTFVILSSSLFPAYVGSKLVPSADLAASARRAVEAYRNSGVVTSRQEPDAPAQGATVGYDYGLLLYTLAETRDLAAEEIYTKVLSLADPTGSWSEYYTGNTPRGTRCRPWESGINLDALLRWAATR